MSLYFYYNNCIVKKYNGNLIKNYTSITDASKDLQKEGKTNALVGTIRSNIKECCIKEKDSAYDYRWSFV